jgi:hypothetical protein
MVFEIPFQSRVCGDRGFKREHCHAWESLKHLRRGLSAICADVEENLWREILTILGYYTKKFYRHKHFQREREQNNTLSPELSQFDVD